MAPGMETPTAKVQTVRSFPPFKIGYVIEIFKLHWPAFEHRVTFFDESATSLLMTLVMFFPVLLCRRKLWVHRAVWDTIRAEDRSRQPGHLCERAGLWTVLPGEVRGQQLWTQAVQLVGHARGGHGLLPGRHVLQRARSEGVRLQRGCAERDGAAGEGDAAASAGPVQRAIQAGAVQLPGPEHRVPGEPRVEPILAERADQVRGRAGRRGRGVHQDGELVQVRADAALVGRKLDGAELLGAAVQGAVRHPGGVAAERAFGGGAGRHSGVLPTGYTLHIQSPIVVLGDPMWFSRRGIPIDSNHGRLFTRDIRICVHY